MSRSIAVLGTIILTTFSTFKPAISVDFGQQEIDQNKYIALASPYGGNHYNLSIFEQISNSQQCWQETGSSPTSVDLLLRNFDFTGICGRSSDSNGYSIRQSGRDLGWQYDLNIIKRGNELVLVGINNTDHNAPPLEIGRSYGMTDGFIKIYLEPGWRFTKRTYNGKELSHIYLTNNF
ncbi:MAG: DUF3747 domain-containing protein [Chamaesiphon sp.]